MPLLICKRILDSISVDILLFSSNSRNVNLGAMEASLTLSLKWQVFKNNICGFHKAVLMLNLLLQRHPIAQTLISINRSQVSSYSC
jgi:hypothetical protein